MPYIGTSPASELANLDINGQKLILDADADTSITSDTDDQIDVEISGADDFRFTANTFTALSGSTIAIASGATIANSGTATGFVGTKLEASSDTSAGDNAAMGYTASEGLILTGQGSTSDITIKNDADADVLTVATGTTTAAFLGDVTLPSAGQLFVGDTADGGITTGMTINQGAADNATFALKSSDVAHGVTGYVETDTYFFIVKEEAANGNAALYGFGEDNTGITLVGVAPNGVTDKATNGHAYIELDARKKSGTGAGNAASNENIMNASHNGSVKFIVDAEGDLHVDGSTTITAYDEYEDAQLGRALELSHGKGVINSKFDKFISYNHEKLADLQLVGREKDGSPNHFLNVTGMQRLHNGAIWQQYEKHENLLNAVYELAVEAVGKDKANKILDKNDIKLLSKNELLN